MSNPVTTYEVGQELCEALGLPKDQVSAIDLHFHAGEIAAATVRMRPHRDQLGKVLSVIKRLELHEKSSEAVPVDER